MRADVMATIHTLRFLRRRLHNYERSRRFISLDTNIRTLSRIARNAGLQRACPAKSARMIFISAFNTGACACVQWMSGDSPNWMRHRLIHEVRHRLINECWEWWDNGACRAIAYRFDWIVLLSTDRHRKKKSLGKYKRLMTHERRNRVSVCAIMITSSLK